MLDGQHYFSHYPDEDPATERKRLMSAELIKALASIEKEIRHCLAGGIDGQTAGAGEATEGTERESQSDAQTGSAER